MTTGGVKWWGYDEFGRLGDGTTTDSAMPVDVAGLTSSVGAITTGGNFTCALSTESVLTCWGIDLTGQPADGATFDRADPVDVVGLASGATAIVAGYYHIVRARRREADSEKRESH